MTQRVSVGHPIDVVTGVLFHEMTDRVLRGRVNVSFGRRYSTAMLPESGGMLGPGWFSPYEMKIRRDLEGYRMLSREGESEYTFDDRQGVLAQGHAVRNPGAFMELRREEAQLVVTAWTPDGQSVVRYLFRDRTDGRWSPLVSVQDVTGQGVDVEHDGRGRIAALRERRSRRAFYLAYNGTGRLAALHQDASRSAAPLVRYRYVDGRLTEVIDGAGFTSAYAYDSAGRMVREVTRTGAVWTFRFDARGRCSQARGQDGFDEKTLEYLPAKRMTRVTDSRGATWTYEYSAAGQVERTITPLGRVWASRFDDLGRQVSIAEPGGAVRAFEYDEASHFRAVTGPEGKSLYAFNAHHQLVRFTDAMGGVWQRKYSREARLEAILNPLGHRWTFSWDERGDLVQLDYPDGGRRRFTHDVNGDVLRESGVMSGPWTYTYGSLGELLDSLTPLGDVTRREYDARGLLVSVLHPDERRTRFEYDAGGLLLRAVRPDGSIFVYRRSGCSRRLTQFSHGAQVLRYQWSQEPSLLTEVINAAGERHSFEYDEDGRLSREVTADGREVLYAYDAGGNLSERTEAGRTTRFAHDLLGLPTQVTYADGATVDIAHDALGRLTRVADAQVELTYERDALGRKLVEKSNDFVVERTFDPMGRVLDRKTSLGHDTRYDYDRDGRLSAMAVGGQQIHFKRDGMGRETSRVLPGGAQVRSAYDTQHRPIRKEVLLAGGSVPSVDRRSQYDMMGRPTRVIDNRWGTSEYSYDAAGWLTSFSDAEGREQYVRDGAGHLVRVETSEAAPPGRLTKTVPPHKDERELAAGGRLLAQDGLSYAYDAWGRVTQLTDRSSLSVQAAWRYTWDTRGRLESVTRPDGAVWRYTYDPFNRRLSKEGPQGQTRFHWDGDVLVHAQRDSELTTWDFLPNAHELVSQQDKGSTLFAVTDHLGVPQELVTEEGRVGWASKLAPFGTPRHEDAPLAECPLRYPGQWADAESGLSYNRHRYYAPWAAQYLSPDPLQLFDDPNGAYGYSTNPLQWTDPLGLINVTYDAYDTVRDRPGGVYAEISPSDIGTGSHATYTPTGFNNAHPDHHERGHLVGRQLGGDGTDCRNIAILTSGTNSPLMRDIETRIRNHIEATGNPVNLLVVPHYDGDSNIPTHLTYVAEDAVTKAILHEDPIPNGQHKKSYNGGACTH
ncbi:RHS repeat-associated core domain-containing protein [Corallococcus exiguus]|uniref:RHS repeat-associated core domain-containing protein n=1 Tax=Corallococcus exiguus TaxID=83462 RepID=UPI001494E033|nr:RHS repeat-associated core domain-containing protein [Corallococcus exiguus]NPD24340.1 hypothetical protein [Corallococcus exiguus]